LRAAGAVAVVARDHAAEHERRGRAVEEEVGMT
jgi:hypothetical protein